MAAALGRVSSPVYSDDLSVTAGNHGYSVPLPGEPLTVPVFASSRESSGEEVPHRHRLRGEEACGNERYHCTSDVSYSCDLIIPYKQQKKRGEGFIWA